MVFITTLLPVIIWVNILLFELNSPTFSLAVKVNISSFNFFLLLWVNLQHLNDVGHQVGQGLVLLYLLLILLDSLLLCLQLVLDPAQL